MVYNLQILKHEKRNLYYTLNNNNRIEQIKYAI